MSQDIKRETVDKVAERIKRSSSLTSEQAHKIARERAEKMNQKRREQR